MTVSELIDLLKKQPQDLQVCFALYSERVLLESEDINVIEACEPRPDGWIQDARPGKPTQKYLCFPGN